MADKIILNKNQRKAVNHTKGPIIVVAGAGTGKTRVIAEKIKKLIKNEGIDPMKILALTFTDKATEEMLTRIQEEMPLAYEEPWVYTFHAFCDRLLKKEGLEIGLDPSYKIISYPKQWMLLRKNLFSMDLKYYLPLGNPTKFIAAILKFISRLQDENILPEELETYVQNKKFEEPEEKERWAELTTLYKKFQELKIQNSKMDFGDLITWTIKLFKKRPNILRKYQEEFQHILVDEFQDTNYAQYELIKLLFPQEKQYERSLSVVGDDSQSIYKFRGAAISNILQFQEDYPKAEMVTLLENYRSGQAILNAAYKLIQNNNPDSLESKLGISKELVSQIKQTEQKPQIAELETAEDEVDYVITKIIEILGKEPQYTYKDFAVLARANNHLGPFVLALRKYGLPYQLVGNRGLYDRDEIRDIYGLVKVLINPMDSISLYRVLNIESLKIEKEAIADLLAISKHKKENLWETVKNSEDEKVIGFVELVKKYQERVAKNTPVELVYNIVQETGYLSRFLEEENIQNQLCIKNLDLFLDKAKKFEVEFNQDTKEIPTLIDFVDYMEMMLEAGDNPAQAEIEDIDTINLMTTHGSKGLEFPVVFIVNTVASRFPTRERGDQIEIPEDLIKEGLPEGNAHIQEERRLFYVGMTRTRKYLFMVYGKDYGGKRAKKPSGFLQETGIKTQKVTMEKDRKKEQESLLGVNTNYREPELRKISNFTPDFLSYTQISTYENCPLKYKYKYVLNVPTLPSHALSFGNTIHETLKLFHERLLFKDVSLVELYKIYEEKWEPLGYLDEKHRKERFADGRKLLKEYYRSLDKAIKPLGLEKSFNIQINEVRFYGKIDRIDSLGNGKVEIIDYKTGKTKTQKEVDKDKQITLYALGAKEALGFNPTKFTLYFVEKNEKINTTRTEENIQKTVVEIKKVIENIKEGNFEPKSGFLCGWCDYKDICPFSWKG